MDLRAIQAAKEAAPITQASAHTSNPTKNWCCCLSKKRVPLLSPRVASWTRRAALGLPARVVTVATSGRVVNFGCRAGSPCPLPLGLWLGVAGGGRLGAGLGGSARCRGALPEESIVELVD